MSHKSFVSSVVFILFCAANLIPASTFAASLSTKDQNRYWRDMVNSSFDTRPYTSQGSTSYQDNGSYDVGSLVNKSFVLSNPKITESWSIMGGSFSLGGDSDITGNFHLLNLGKDYGVEEMVRTVRKMLYVKMQLTADFMDMIEQIGGADVRAQFTILQNKWLKIGRVPQTDQQWITNWVNKLKSAALRHPFLTFTGMEESSVSGKPVANLSAAFDRSAFIDFVIDAGRPWSHATKKDIAEARYYMDAFLSRITFDKLQFSIGTKDHNYYGSSIAMHTLSLISVLQAYDKYKNDPRFDTDATADERKATFTEVLNSLRFDAAALLQENRSDHGKKPKIEKPQYAIPVNSLK